jgi:carbamoyl-phosphate synthase small subunit
VGAPGRTIGEVVFNTAMTGYQEILTDPSYRGQLITMTYPLIGNYGVNPEDVESAAVQAEAFLLKEYLPFPSNYRSRGSLGSYLEQSGVLGLEGIDTRALTRHLRNFGAMRSAASTETLDPEDLTARARAILPWPATTWWIGLPPPDLTAGTKPAFTCRRGSLLKPGGSGSVVVFDYGVKYNILRNLEQRICQVLVVPA